MPQERILVCVPWGIVESFRRYLPACLLTERNVLLERAFGTSPLPWTPGPVTWALRRPLSRVLDASPGRSPLEVTQRRFVSSGCAPLRFVHVAPLRPTSVSRTITWAFVGVFFLPRAR